jgi:hypothetical protein
MLSLIWLLLGAGLDGWAHFHGQVDGTFFTPWHAIMYSGFLAVMTVHIGIAYVNARRGYQLWDTLPVGYGSSLVGVLVFAIGGLLDMLWHLAFGVEASIAALLSPTHTVLLVGFALILSGPCRATLVKAQPGEELTWRRNGAAVLSLGFALAIVLAYLSYVSPFGGAWSAAKYAPQMTVAVAPMLGWPISEFAIALGIVAVMFQSGVVVSVFIFMERRVRLPVPGYTLVMPLAVLLVVVMYDEYRLLVPALLVGLFLDLLARRVDVRALDGRKYGPLGALIGGGFSALYFGTILLTGGTWWPIHVVTGAVLMAVLAGYAVGYVAGGALARLERGKSAESSG